MFEEVKPPFAGKIDIEKIEVKRELDNTAKPRPGSFREYMKNGGD